MFGANRAYQRWRRMMDKAVTDARALLEKDPTNPKGLALVRAADHSLDCAWAFAFGRPPSTPLSSGGTSLGDSDSVAEKKATVCGKMQRLWENTVAFCIKPRCILPHRRDNGNYCQPGAVSPLDYSSPPTSDLNWPERAKMKGDN